VKFNQRVHELPEVDNIFIHPAMDDSGLSVGSALAALAEAPNQDPKRLIQPLTNVYFGNQYNAEEIETAVKSADCQAEYLPNIHESVARLLAEGHVVARFTGAMEYGPRALGHRTILYQTTDPSVNDWLNARLKRTEFMPFAPATLTEFAASRYEGIEGAMDPARFMTITFNCTEQMKRESPGVVHIDGTARPQLIDSKTAPDFYEILSAYHQMTGIPSLINTSFNMHGEPIVCTPDDAMRSFQAGNLDYLAIGNWLVKHPSLLEEEQLTAAAVQV
jgi:carbamoyltransferase